MGADTFQTIETGSTVAEAFRKAVDNAAYEHGHGGYTGTIAEKHEYTIIPVPADWAESASAYADHLVSMGDPRIDDKWGPAGAIQLDKNKWLFFGWASS